MLAELRERLQAAGRTFESDTDTEVIAALLDSELAAGLEPIKALKATLDQLSGAYALGVLIEGESGLVMGARRGSPLVVGYGDLKTPVAGMKVTGDSATLPSGKVTMRFKKIGGCWVVDGRD